jgi:hypothetical protein
MNEHLTGSFIVERGALFNIYDVPGPKQIFWTERFQEDSYQFHWETQMSHILLYLTLQWVITLFVWLHW